eukprot:COSAG05_NODE_9854_length_597_cov_1.136546_1_plen_44_part_01
MCRIYPVCQEPEGLRTSLHALRSLLLLLLLLLLSERLILGNHSL